MKDGLKSANPEVAKRCSDLLAAIRSELLRSKDSPVWQRFKVVAGDDDEAWKLYLRMVGTLRRGEMLLASVRDSKSAAASYTKEREEMTALLKPPDGPVPAPKEGKVPDQDKGTDNLASLLFLGILVNGTDAEKPSESKNAIISGLVHTNALRGKSRTAFGRLYAAWTLPRREMWRDGLFRAMVDRVPAMTGVAREALAAKKRFNGTNELVLALHILGQHGTPADIPLLMNFSDDVTECGRMEFFEVPWGRDRRRK